ncbi:MAG TPA: DUF58 domain-containing protein [Fimbriimonadaceae bacterium]|nr:DUF58 domain-containing protein [Fimbriimonadaceae bacterium]HRJ96581.1 DUF58 domain-containing protein [Fimbriimonadaceae bacterium]
MRNVARTVPFIAALFLATMAILINSPALFYMATAMFATILASRAQAWLSVRGLRFERVSPPTVNVGDTVTVGLVVWSERRLKRPLVTIVDGLPRNLVCADLTPSLPVAPSYDQPIHTKYSFRPLRRGKFRWAGLEVFGTDALGLITMSKEYATEPAELTVYPAPITVSVPIPPAAGWGTSEAESGRFRGSGIEPRGVREYSAGDPMRYVHWASSARAGKLMVKEFESGSGLVFLFVLQRTRGTEVGVGGATTFEAMCGHCAYLAEQYLRQGATVAFPGLEEPRSVSLSQTVRKQEIYEILASIQADQTTELSTELAGLARDLPEGGTLVLMVSSPDPQLPIVLGSLTGLQKVCLIYDANDYRPARLARLPSATDPAYLGQLRDAGAEVFVMPKVEAVR